MGIEPTIEGFADPCLTTWLRRHGLREKRLPLGQTHRAIGRFLRAGDGIRTHDLLLGKETFYH